MQNLTVDDCMRRLGRSLAPRRLLPLPHTSGVRTRSLYRVVDDLLLVLAIEFSRGRFTASWWLGATFLWPYVPQIQDGWRLYRRAPALLTVDERRAVLGVEDVVAEGADYWWPSRTENAIDSLQSTLAMTEHRFLEQAPVSRLAHSEHTRQARQRIRDVLVGAGPQFGAALESGATHALQLLYPSARDVLSQVGGRANRAEFESLAMDALRCYSSRMGWVLGE